MWHQPARFDSLRVYLYYVKSEYFFSLTQGVDRVSETQLQVGEKSNWIIWRLKG